MRRAVLFAVVILASAGTLVAASAPTPSLPVQESTLRIRQVVDTSQASYTEGWVSFIRVRDAGGTVVARKRMGTRGGRLTVTLPADTYRIISFLRPCAGNCELLDPPTDRCSRRVELLPQTSETVRVRVTVKPRESCGIRFRR